MNNINVVVIEDADSIRKSLVAELITDTEFSTVRSYGTIENFIFEDKEEPFPDVVVLDIQLPKVNGDEAIDMILLTYPKTNILIYSMYMDSSMIIKCISKGAVGYILKSQHSIKDIVEAIKIVKSGGSYLSPIIARKVLNYFHPSSEKKSQISLTIREEQVMNGLVNGSSYQEIANELNISIDTVRTYVKKIYGKMQVKSKVQLLSKIKSLFYIKESNQLF
ncbi:MAG: hypothetical protein DI598_18470 [Pseudopedobacter saltans]|uniref:Two component transcriptional regulator, LuxR family n=1 Tax=Pseudopedobacter saltans TaxID=151895 RepID=A0A2W5EA64_9SPHI|nr:MAG: hypothetical protein DI598_18470 [Pseudopedobacter saltans]